MVESVLILVNAISTISGECPPPECGPSRSEAVRFIGYDVRRLLRIRKHAITLAIMTPAIKHPIAVPATMADEGFECLVTVAAAALVEDDVELASVGRPEEDIARLVADICVEDPQLVEFDAFGA